MIHIFKSLSAKLWFGFVVLVLIAGVVMGAARLLLPWASELRGDVETWVSKTLGRPVEIGVLHAGLHGLDPQLVLENVTLFDTGKRHERLHLDELRLQVDLLGSLGHGEVRIKNLILVGARLLVRRHRDGRLEVAGLVEGGGAGDNGVAAVLMNEGRLQLKESEVLWDNRRIGAEPVYFEDVEVSIVNHRGRHQIDATAYPHGEEKARMRLAADLFGDVASPDRWGGEIYLKGKRLSLGPMKGVQLPGGYRVVDGMLDLEMWGQWRNGTLSHTEGRLRTADLELSVPQRGADDLQIASVEGAFHWRRNGQGWDLDFADFGLQYGPSIWPQGRMSLAFQHDGERMRLKAGADFVRLGDVLDMIESASLLDAETVSALHALNPRGDLHDLRLDLTLADGRVADWAAGARVVDWWNAAWRRLPALSDVDFTFLANPTAGWIALDATNMAVAMPWLFRDALQARQLSGTVDWRRDETERGWVIQSRALDLSNQDVATRSRFRLVIPFDGASPWADIQTDFHEADAAAIRHYLPVGIMRNKKLVNWLDRAFVGGRVPSGAFLLHGPLKPFPYRQNEGRFEVLFGVQDLTLDYDEEWPRLESMRGEARFLNNSLEVMLEAGRIFDSQIGPTHARIDDLKLTSPLVVEGVVDGPLNDVVRLLRETPLKKRFQRFADALRVKGRSHLQIGFTAPIEKGRGKGQWQVNGDLQLSDAMLDLPAQGVQFSKIKGHLGFDLDGVHARGLRGRVFDTPLMVDVQTLPEAHKTRISAQFSPEIRAWAGRAPEWNLGWIDGQPNLDLTVDIGHGEVGSETPLSFALRSDLKGVRVDLPAPLGKGPETVRELDLSGDLAGTSTGLLRIGYGGILKALFELDMARPQGPLPTRGELRLGGGAPALPMDRYLRLVGHLKHLDLAPWVAFLRDPPFAFGMGGRDLPPPLVDVQVGSATLGHEVLKQVAFRASEKKEGWLMEMTSDRLAGRLLFPPAASRKPVDIRLSRLALRLGDDDAGKMEQADGKTDTSSDSGLNPRRMPPMKLRIDALTVNDQPFGTATARSHTTDDGVMIDAFALDAPLLNLKGKGKWQLKRGVQKTVLEIEGQCTNLGKMLRELGFSSALDAAPLEMDSRFEWRGAPWAFAARNLEGRLTFNIGSGRLLDVEPGAGRVFGLLNLGALWRRLTLDFSDLFGKGFSFDRIEGAFTLTDGDAYTDGVVVEGPSARVDVKGRIGLAKEDYDEFITVLPRLSSGLPLAGMLAGGPTAGAVMLVIQQLLGSQVDKLGRIRYHVTGGWNEPKYEKLGGRADVDESILAPGAGISARELLNR